MAYQAAIFDLDGTLLNTLEDLTNGVNYALAKYDLPLKEQTEIRRFLGNGIKQLVTLSLEGGQEHPLFNEVFETFKSYYSEHNNEATAPYEGISDLLNRLKEAGIPMAIVSNKIDGAVQVLHQDYFNEWIDFAVGERPDLKRKPDRSMVDYCLSEMALARDQVVYIGDSEVDIATARHAEIDCIAVTWGFRDEAFILEHRPQYIVRKPLDIVDLILG